MKYAYEITKTVGDTQTKERFEVDSMKELLACYRAQTESEHGVVVNVMAPAGDAHLQEDLLK